MMMIFDGSSPGRMSQHQGLVVLQEEEDSLPFPREASEPGDQGCHQSGFSSEAVINVYHIDAGSIVSIPKKEVESGISWPSVLQALLGSQVLHSHLRLLVRQGKGGAGVEVATRDTHTSGIVRHRCLVDRSVLIL